MQPQDIVVEAYDAVSDSKGINGAVKYCLLKTMAPSKHHFVEGNLAIIYWSLTFLRSAVSLFTEWN